MCLTYIVAEVTNCEQADVDFRGHEEIFAESGGVMDHEEDRTRPKRDKIRIETTAFGLSWYFGDDSVDWLLSIVFSVSGNSTRHDGSCSRQMSF
ncbi:hypothetical protein Leryth_021699 [Lithospermum erythrorhizon]|nr:hypothetical protein Leryth_021699 [Lithospermum erythrorhizon]